MSQDLGRISGPMLKENLERSGVDLAFETDLLYLDVANDKIGINTDGFTADLEVNSHIKTTNLITSNSQTVGNIVLNANGSIESLYGPIIFAPQGSNPQISISALETQTLRLSDNYISSTESNANIELRPHGTGKVEIFNSTNIQGNLNATGKITLGGTITIGSADDDSVSFNADIKSNVIPDQNLIFDLGRSDKRWSELNTRLVNGNVISAENSFQIDSLDLLLRQGNIWYVATTGSNTNVGDHQDGPFLTIAKALSEASSGDTVYIYPGEYPEVMPLTVPQGVTVKGTGIRSVTVKPTEATKNNNVFLINGECTVSDLTVKDFYQPGYAFSFANNFAVSTRSPYIQNVSVITKGSVTSESDPLGFNQGDAGGGAKVDGSLALSSTNEASMLFHSVTMITPGVDALVMTNGVRVEWLNSFTYFANKGLYAIRGTGRISQDGSTIRYGAEVRSIGSANVYGNYGAVADGVGTLMYLISHNFGYIGAGKDSSNDSTLIIQTNETVELNSGVVHYNSQDQSGNYRVGDAFFVDFDTGNVSFDVGDISLLGISNLKFINNSNITFINAQKIETGNYRLSENLIENIVSNINITAAGGAINLNNNSNILGNISVTGDANIAGQVIFGNAVNDSISVFARITSDITPDVTKTYNIGLDNKRWRTSFLNDIDLGNIVVSGNVISTTESNSNLELVANGSGFVVIEDLRADQDVTVTLTTDLKNTEINSLLTVNGTRTQTGNYTQTGNRSVSGILTVNDNATFGKVLFDGNFISTTDSNTDLTLEASGTGEIKFDSNNVVVTNNIIVQGATSLANLNISSLVSAVKMTNTDLLFDTNFITTTANNDNLILQAAGTGILLLPTSSAIVDNNLTIGGFSDLTNLSITGTFTVNSPSGVTHIGSISQTGDATVTGNIVTGDFGQFGAVKIHNNFITTTSGDLAFSANGTGIIDISSNNVEIGANIAVLGDTAFASIDISNAVSFLRATNNKLVIQNNFIENTTVNANLIFTANGAGLIYSPDTNFLIENDLTVEGPSIVKNSNIIGTINLLGNYNQTGNKNQTGSTILSGSVTADNAVLSNVIANTNYLSTTSGNLELTAAGTGIVDVPLNNVVVDNNISITGITQLASVTINNNVVGNVMVLPSITLDDNFVTTTSGNQNLELRANGIGKVLFPTASVDIDNNLSVDGISNLKNTSITGTNIVVGNTTQTGSRTQIGNLQTSNLTASGFYLNSINLVGNVITTKTGSQNLVLEANSTGEVYVPTNNVLIDNNLTVFGLPSFNNINITQDIVSSQFFNSNILIQDNFITTTESNANLEFRGHLTAGVDFEKLRFSSNILKAVDTNSNINFVPGADKNFIINKTNALKLPVGTTAQRSTLTQGEMRLNSSISNFEGFSTVKRTFGGLFSENRNTYVISESVKFANDNTLQFVTNNTSAMQIANNNVRLTGLLVDNDIFVNENVISTTQANSDINLIPNGTGFVQFSSKLKAIGNEFINTSATTESVKFSSTGNGYVKFVGTDGIVIPVGGSSDRMFQEVGEIRWNSDLLTIEIFDGSNYISAGGVGGVTEEYMQELSDIYAIILG